MTQPNAAEIAERWPEAVQIARTLREVFGDGVMLVYARNEAGEELVRRGFKPPPKQYPTKP